MNDPDDKIKEQPDALRRMCRALAAHAVLVANPHLVQQNIDLRTTRQKVEAVTEFILACTLE